MIFQWSPTPHKTNVTQLVIVILKSSYFWSWRFLFLIYLCLSLPLYWRLWYRELFLSLLLPICVFHTVFLCLSLSFSSALCISFRLFLSLGSSLPLFFLLTFFRIMWMRNSVRYNVNLISKQLRWILQILVWRFTSQDDHLVGTPNFFSLISKKFGTPTKRSPWQ